MGLKNDLSTETGWEIVKNNFEEDQLITTGSNFMIGNGYLGYRGTLAEWGADEYVGCIVTDTYDMADGKWRELCNVPNGLFTKLVVEGEEMSVFDSKVLNYQQKIDFKNALYNRETAWQTESGVTVDLAVEKFASYDNLHLIAMDYKFSVDEKTEIKVVTGIDGEVWDLNGKHFKDYRLLEEDNLLAIETTTGEQEINVDVVEGLNILGAEAVEEKIEENEEEIYRHLTFELEADSEVILRKVAGIYSSNDVDNPLEAAKSDVKEGLEIGYSHLKENHINSWDELWSVSDIKIEGDLEAQTVLRFNLYHNIICTPAHSDELPIGARGLSCQAYQGAAFWDQEIFNMPMFLYTQPEIAKNILTYRYKNLDGARNKARQLGYYGAYYPWISGKSGEELCPDFFFENVLTGRKIRNHFNDWQIHVSPDIAYAVWHYYQATDDWEFIEDFGAEIVFEVAQFLVSHAYFKKDKNRYEIVKVVGPDEYHENVDNNAFTNYQAQYVLDKAVDIYNKLEETAPEKLSDLSERIDIDESDLEMWEEMAELMYLPESDEDTLLIEQFEGYFDLEDVTPEEVEERLQDPHEYLGWPVGVATRTQVTKQADLLQLFCMQNRFSEEVMRANYDYYEPRCEHGSSLSPSAHSIIAGKIGYLDDAYDYFMESCTVDLYNRSKAIHGGTFIGGIHTAACGAAWKMIVQGFAGLELPETPEDNEVVSFTPGLPEKWEKVKFNFCYRYNEFEITMTEDEFIIKAAADNDEEAGFKVAGEKKAISSGEKVQFKVE